MKSSIILLCLLAGVAGCSSKDNAEPNATVASFCDSWAKSACSPSIVSVCSGADKVDEALTQSCLHSQQTFCESLLPATGYSSEKASQCLTAVKAAYSDGKLSASEIATVRHRGDPCNHLVKGPQGKGDACTSDDECDTVKDYLCVIKSGLGTCQIPVVVENGTSCAAPGAACHDGFYCDGDNCVQSKAVNLKCSADFECTTGLICDPATSKCVARVSQKDCMQDNDCTSNVCDIPVGSSTGLCVSTITLGASQAICADLR
jgi:hypothetical protein